MANKINIAVVDDQQLFRKGIVALLRQIKDFNICFEAENGEDFFEKLEDEITPDVILLDLQMPVMDGIATTVKLKKRFPEVKIIILTMHDEEEMIVHLIEKGAHGFLPKNEEIKNVIDSIYSVHQTGHFFNEKVSQALVRGLMSSKKITPIFENTELNEREIKIVQLICKELTSPEIGKELLLSTKTIDNHRMEILKKVGARNTAGLVMYAMKKGLIS
ncbi:MAG TPA: response regulator transcription factor [Bacteroidia bacterium]|jgi:DNA-binding NarL/FixJ family response regulator|nr:response regulator transcription factor [Bacteroidia bacterium]